MKLEMNRKDYVWSYIGTIVSLSSGVIILPFALYYLSDEMYGLWGIFQSLSYITVLFDFGFSVTFARNINYCWCGATKLEKLGCTYAKSKEPNYPLMRYVLYICQCVFLILSFVAMLFILIPGTVYIKYVCRPVQNENYLLAWCFYAMAIFLNLYFCYYNAFLRGVGAVFAANKVTVIAKMFQVIFTIVFLKRGFGIVGISIAFLAYGIIYRLLSKWEFERFHHIGSCLKAVSERISIANIKEIFKVIWYSASREGIVTLSTYLSMQACTIIGGVFLPLRILGTYSLATQLVTVVANVAMTLYTANLPVLQAAFVTQDKKRTKTTMSLIIFSYLVLFVLGMLIVVIIGLPVVKLIKPDSVPSIMVISGVGLYQFILNYRNCYASYFSCTNRIIYAKAYVVAALLCVVLVSFALYMQYGVFGMIAAQIFSQVIYNFWRWPMLAHKEMKLSITEMLQLGIMETKKIVLKPKNS